MGSTDALVCPACGRAHPSSERFCSSCGMPLVHGEQARAEQAASLDESKLSGQRRRARKIKPQYAEGALVKAVGARNQTEAEFIQGLLLEEGVPSVLRRTRGFDVPDFLAAGPRDVLVPQSGAAVAREVLLQSELVDPEAAMEGVMDSPWRVMMGLLVAVAVVAALVWLLTQG